MFRKLTSQKRKLKITIIIGRLQCCHPQEPNTYQAIIKRGSQSVHSQPFRSVKNSVFKLDNDTFNFDSTFHFDQETKTYLDKELTITIKETDKKVREEACRIEINLSEYLNSSGTYFALEYDFDYRKQQGKLYFDIDFNQEGQTKMNKKASLPQTAATTENSSPEKVDFFQSYALHQEECEKESKMVKLQNENNLLRQEIERLLTVQNKKSVIDSTNQKNDEQRRQLKQKLDQKDTQLGIALDKNRQLQEKYEKAQRQLRQQSKVIQQLTEELEKAKNKVVNLVQQCLEIGDSDMISLVQRHCG